MPKSPEIDLNKLQKKAINEIKKFAGEAETKNAIEPVAFGLKVLKITFVMDENRGGTEELENNISKLGGVNSVEVIDVRRAIG